MSLLPYALNYLEGCIRHWTLVASEEENSICLVSLEQILFLYSLEDTEQKEIATFQKIYKYPHITAETKEPIYKSTKL